jgi:hypothetical protein
MPVSSVPEHRLDHRKLFGFRNLLSVTAPGSSLRKSAELAFPKQGTESAA